MARDFTDVCHCSDVTWTSSRPKSSATGLFVRQVVLANTKENALLRSCGDRWIPHTKASNTERVSMSCSLGSQQWYACIGWWNGLLPISPQEITWANDDTDLKCHLASLGPNELTYYEISDATVLFLRNLFLVINHRLGISFLCIRNCFINLSVADWRKHASINQVIISSDNA